jgi:hypothetical protein
VQGLGGACGHALLLLNRRSIPSGCALATASMSALLDCSGISALQCPLSGPQRSLRVGSWCVRATWRSGLSPALLAAVFMCSMPTTTRSGTTTALHCDLLREPQPTLTGYDARACRSVFEPLAHNHADTCGACKFTLQWASRFCVESTTVARFPPPRRRPRAKPMRGTCRVLSTQPVFAILSESIWPSSRLASQALGCSFGCLQRA